MMTEEKKEKEIKWTYKDMIWSVIVLIAIIILILSIKISSDQNITNILSIGGSLISIVLGIVAILISVIQNNSSVKLNGRVSTTLELINQRLESIGSQINTMQPPYSKKSTETNGNEIEANKITRLHGIYNSISQWSGKEFIAELNNELIRINQNYKLLDYSIKPLKIGQDQVFKCATSVSLLFNEHIQTNILDEIIKTAFGNIGINSFSSEVYTNNNL